MIGGMKPISFIATNDPEETKSFCGETLGLKLSEASPFALVFLNQDHMLRVQIVEDHVAAEHTVHGWQVDDIEQTLKVLSAKGVKPEVFSALEQNDLGVWVAPGGAKIAWFKDPSGNVLSLTQFHD